MLPRWSDLSGGWCSMLTLDGATLGVSTRDCNYFGVDFACITIRWYLLKPLCPRVKSTSISSR